MMVKVIKQCLPLMAYLIASILAIDLLALYYLGGWIEPRDIIRIAELASLYLFSIGGITLAVIETRRIVRG